ncbi:methionine--tRNA ligase [Bacteroidia bacterium]|nr:methionine--tRNA ligase [Bacteroidia bacterium]
MLKNISRYTITTALPYANGPLHIGHLAGVYIPADIYARYLRMNNKDVVLIGGSDEHGVPITIKARKEGVSPQNIVDRYHEIIKKSMAELGISFDIYSRTSNAMHHQTASDFFKKLYDNGKFIEKTSMQFYDEENKQFLADRYIVGECPHCHYDAAYGDQCEKCGSSLSPNELINPKSAISGNMPVLKETKHWYLPLDKYEQFFREWILKGHKDDWKVNVYGQCKSWIDQGLQPRAVTRDLDWGVKVPVDNAEGKVLYVWFDAPIGYISATKELTDDWEKYWKADDTKLVHFIGKDNIVFHCLIFPAMLKAEGSYILPDNVPANEFLNLEGNKISTSKNWAVWLHKYLEDFPNKQDVLRYVLTANAPETKDNDFTWTDFQTRNNSELVAILGNFVNRIMVLNAKYFESKVPPITELQDIDKDVLNEISKYPKLIGDLIENYHFRDALNELMNLARLGNKYLTETEPWKVYKTDAERVKTILNVSLQIVANIAILSEPFMPFTSTKIKKMLGMNKTIWADAGNGNIIKAGQSLGTAELLFDKIEDEQIATQIEKLHSAN